MNSETKHGMMNALFNTIDDIDFMRIKYGALRRTMVNAYDKKDDITKVGEQEVMVLYGAIYHAAIKYLEGLQLQRLMGDTMDLAQRINSDIQRMENEKNDTKEKTRDSIYNIFDVGSSVQFTDSCLYAQYEQVLLMLRNFISSYVADKEFKNDRFKLFVETIFSIDKFGTYLDLNINDLTKLRKLLSELMKLIDSIKVDGSGGNVMVEE